MILYDCEICRSDKRVCLIASSIINGYTLLPQNYGVTWCSNCGTIKTIYNGKETIMTIGDDGCSIKDGDTFAAREKYLKKSSKKDTPER
jgi:hypothetical protein